MKTTLRTFLEDFSNENALTAEDAANLINTRGQHYKELIGNIRENLLYRGMRERFSPDAVLKYVRMNRRPLTTNAAIHQAADEFFEEKFGIRFRSNAIFAVGDVNIASSYGDVYAIFPLDEVKICWAEDVVDMTNHVNMHLGSVEKKDGFVHASEALSAKELGDRAYQILAQADYTVNDDNLKRRYFSRLFKRNEVMIHCEDYVAVREEFLPEVLKLVK